jgi:hypothetical protein
VSLGLDSLVPLPKDATLVELRPDVLVFRTRECLLPGTVVGFSLVMEGHPLPLRLPAEACLVVEKSRSGYVFHSRFSLAGLPEADRHLITLFITKGRGEPRLEPLAGR